jgi:hypothetical protein
MAFIRYAKAAEDDAVVCVQLCNGDQGIGRITFTQGIILMPTAGTGEVTFQRVADPSLCPPFRIRNRFR